MSMSATTASGYQAFLQLKTPSGRPACAPASASAGGASSPCSSVASKLPERRGNRPPVLRPCDLNRLAVARCTAATPMPSARPAVAAAAALREVEEAQAGEEEEEEEEDEEAEAEAEEQATLEAGTATRRNALEAATTQGCPSAGSSANSGWWPAGSARQGEGRAAETSAIEERAGNEGGGGDA
mmetsp:Transcript_75302/g.212095  ORF Transcript_75302/g.212095 Transcript_75302/m.212095 type:complete len:184 (+) Transcript_75302:1472-2023(+)